ncbi:transmembrane protein, putative (macronuclear) [Tetrahymena thermophila SB210]|uniref:Transmembrane protein, putative n=1 Tax=Tetrahymena thermophila (strain SB210) TaxID=312017 RepID=I7M904_TETTS|nr:transmembrane protein, putative [Tetrahymena thermophila SB210]EAS00394.2 transmembrane protein, putative [Tetrahymena thermophila SB210]|eukprot:XP_001020639.2 transmembrane protein, putative [Tetrahymena thermophila SB210]
MKKGLVLSWLTIFHCTIRYIIAQNKSLQILPLNYQDSICEATGTSKNYFMFKKFPQPMQTDQLSLKFNVIQNLNQLTFQLFDNTQVNQPQVLISTTDGETINLEYTYSKGKFIFSINDQQQQYLQNNFIENLIINFQNITNTANSNVTAGKFVMIQNSSQQSTITYNVPTNLYYSINQCQLVPINLISNSGCHILGNVTFSIDFSYNMIFSQNDSLLLSFQYQEYLGASQTLAYPPSDFSANLNPYFNISQIQAWVQQVYANSPQQNLNVSVIDSQSILISGFQNVQINNLEGQIDQQLIITLSNLYYPPTVKSKLMFDMYLIDKQGFYKCSQKVSLIQQNTSPFSLFNVSFSSVQYGSPLTLNITIVPQRYMLSYNSTLTLNFSSNVQIPTIQNLNVTGISFFQTSNTQYSVINNQIVFQNFLTSSVSSDQQIVFTIQGLQVPMYGGNVSIIAQNSYFNQYPQHQSSFTQLIYCNSCLKLTFQSLVIAQNSSIQFNFTNQYQLQNKGFINLIFPQSFFGNLQNTPQPQNIQLIMNSQNFQSQLSVLNNVLTIPYTQATTLPANQLIYFQLNYIQNFLSTYQVYDSFEYQILDQNRQVYYRSLIQLPQCQPDLLYITAWQSLMQMQLSNTNSILLSFYVNSDSFTIDGLNQNSVQIQFSNSIQFTQNSVFVFLDGFSQQKQLNWTYSNNQLKITNFTLQKQLNYTIILQNVTLSRFQSVVQTPQIQTFGNSFLLHQIAQGQNPLQLNLTDPYLLKNVQLQIMNSTFINTVGNIAVLLVFLENLQILTGESVQIYLDKSCDLSMLNSLAIQSSSIPSSSPFQISQFNLDSQSNQNQNIISFSIPINLPQQIIKSDLSIQLSFINNPIYLVSIQYKVCFINSLGQIYASSFSLLFNELQPLSLNTAISYDGTQDSKLLGDQFKATLQIQSVINLPPNGLIKISGFGKSLLLNEQNLKVTSQKCSIQSINYNETSTILSFKYLNLTQIQTDLPILINGLSTYQTSEFSFNDLQLQIFDYNQGSNLISLITPLNISISNLLCSSKCIKCYISSNNCVLFNSTNSSSNNNNNSTSGQGNNNNNNSTSGNNGNNNGTSNNNNQNNNNTSNNNCTSNNSTNNNNQGSNSNSTNNNNNSNQGGQGSNNNNNNNNTTNSNNTNTNNGGSNTNSQGNSGNNNNNQGSNNNKNNNTTNSNNNNNNNNTNSNNGNGNNNNNQGGQGNSNNNNNNSSSSNNSNTNNSYNDTKNFCDIKNCAKCDKDKCNYCLECMSGYQLSNSKCVEHQQYKLSAISVSIILSISISMSTYLLKSNTRMYYLLLVQWVCIEMYCQIQYLSQVLLDIIDHLNQNETREQVLLQIIHLVLLTFIVIFYLFTQFSFHFIRNQISQSYTKVLLQSKFQNFIKWTLNALSIIEFRIFYISFIFQDTNNYNNQYSFKLNNQSQMEQSNIFQQQNTQNSKSGQNSYSHLIQDKSNLNSKETLNKSNNNHKQYVIFILSSIQNLLKIVMISVDISNTSNTDKIIQLYEMIAISILLLSLHSYIIIKSLNIYKIKRQIVPFFDKQNCTLNNVQKNKVEQNIIQKSNIQSSEKLQTQEPQIQKQDIYQQNFTCTPSQIIHFNNVKKQISQNEQQENIQQQLQQQSPIKKQDRRKRTKFSHIILNERIQAFKND